MLYDPENNILLWEIAEGEISHTREFGNFILHLSANGLPLLIEIMNASGFMGQFNKIRDIKDLKKIMPQPN